MNIDHHFAESNMNKKSQHLAAVKLKIRNLRVLDEHEMKRVFYQFSVQMMVKIRLLNKASLLKPFPPAIPCSDKPPNRRLLRQK